MKCSQVIEFKIALLPVLENVTPAKIVNKIPLFFLKSNLLLCLQSYAIRSCLEPAEFRFSFFVVNDAV
jgi:hypothetical protein